MPEFQRLVIWLHLDKKNNNNNGKEKNKQSVQEYKTKREGKKNLSNTRTISYTKHLTPCVSDQQLIQ